jgi:hypothetical protein
MLHQTLSKGWCRHGSGLLLGFIVRPNRGLVEAQPRLRATENRSACPAKRSGGHHSGHPRSVAPLEQREGLLALGLGAPALLLPYPLFSKPTQPAYSSSGARVASSAASLRPRTRRAFGTLPRAGHDARPGDGAGEGFSQGALLRPSDVRQQRLQEDRVGLRLQGGSGGRPRGRGKRLRAGICGLRRETHRGRSHILRPSRDLLGRQRLHGGPVGATMAGGLRSARCSDSQKRRPAGLAEVRIGAGPRAADTTGRQGRGLHLRTKDKRFPGPTAASPGGPIDLVRCTSLV